MSLGPSLAIALHSSSAVGSVSAAAAAGSSAVASGAPGALLLLHRLFSSSSASSCAQPATAAQPSAHPPQPAHNVEFRDYSSSASALPLPSNAGCDVAAAAVAAAAAAGHLHSAGLEFNLKAIMVDAAGTLLEPTEPVPEVYLRLGRTYGVELSQQEILSRYRRAFSMPHDSRLRYEADGREYWSFVAAKSTGCSHPGFLKDLHEYYSDKEAWKLTDPHAGDAFEAMRRAGLKLAVVSNFDTRLRSILRQLGCLDWFDALAVSAEVEAEKPNPVIFWRACEMMGVKPEESVHVGDDRRNDVWGARDAGCHAWLWNDDVSSFQEVAERVGVKVDRS